MNEDDWSEIPGRLAGAGFAVCHGRISSDPECPLWAARASRDGLEWSTLGEDLRSAFLELEGQTEVAGEDWRRIMGEGSRSAHAATGTAWEPESRKRGNSHGSRTRPIPMRGRPDREQEGAGARSSEAGMK
jgi:hypothetical protein